MHEGLIILDSHAYERIYGQEHLEAISSRMRLLAQPMTAREALERPDLLARANVIFSGWGAPKMDLSPAILRTRLVGAALMLAAISLIVLR